MLPAGGRPSAGELAANRALMAARGWGEALDAAGAARAGGHLNAANACAALGRLAKLPPPPPAAAAAAGLPELLGEAAALAAGGAAGPRQLSGTLWACAKLRGLWASGPCLAELGRAERAAAEAAAPLAPRFKPQELSNALWALAKAAGAAAEGAPAAAGGGTWEPWRAKVFGALAAGAARSLQLCGGRGAWAPQALANLAWALAALAGGGGGEGAGRGGGAGALLGELLGALSVRAGELNPQEVASTLGALARLSESGAPWARVVREGAAVPALAARAAVLRGSLSPRQVANAAWALAKLGEASASRGLLQAAAEGGAGGCLGGMNVQELSMCAWALASSGAGGEELAAVAVFRGAARCLRTEAQAGPATGLAHPLATTAWAAAKLGVCEPELGDATAWALVRPEGGPCLRGASARDLAYLAWGAAKLGAFPGLDADLHAQALERLFAEAARRAGEGFPGPRPAVMLLWAMATSKWRGEAEVGALLHVCRDLLRSGGASGGASAEEASDRDLADLAFALGALRGPAERAAPGALQALLRHLGDLSADRLAGCNAQELLRLLGGFRRAGGRSERLEAAVGGQRVVRYRFGGLEINLQAAVPTALQDWHRLEDGESPEAEGGGREGAGAAAATSGAGSRKRKRVDDCCGGTGRPNTGVALWQAGYFLAEWLSRQGTAPGGGAAGSSKAGAAELRAALPPKGKIRRKWSGRVAVELGAGLGLPSIVGARALGLRVIATDGDPDALSLLRQNARDNVAEVCEGSASGGEMRVEELRWGSEKPLERLGLKKKADLVMASDVVYGSDPTKWRALLSTLKSLCGGKTLAVVANMQRYPLHHELSEARLLERELVAAGFEVARAPQAALHPDAQGTGGANSCALFLCRRAPKKKKNKNKE